MVRRREKKRGAERETEPHGRGRNITKVSAASQFARSKRALVSGPETGQKKSACHFDEQIKIACIFFSPPSPRARVFTFTEGKTKDWKGERAARCLSERRGGFKSIRRDQRTIVSFLWSPRANCKIVCFAYLMYVCAGKKITREWRVEK